MKLDPVQIITNGDMSQANIISIGINLSQLCLYSIQAVFTGAPSGTFKVQLSCDRVPVNAAPGADPASNVVNWTDYTGSSQVVSAAGNFAWIISDAGYLWARLVYTKTSGTGSLNANFIGKG